MLPGGCLVLGAVTALPPLSPLEGHDQGGVCQEVLLQEEQLPTSVPKESQGSPIRGNRHSGGSVVLQKGLGNEAELRLIQTPPRGSHDLGQAF